MHGVHYTRPIIGVLLFCFLSPITTLFAQERPDAFWQQFTRLEDVRPTLYQETDGLPSDFVITSYRDSRGHLWVGTQEGLARFDGYSFDQFFADPSDSTGLNNHHVSDIAEDQHGYLWMTTHGGGLNRYDPYTHTFRHFLAPREDSSAATKNEFRTLFIDTIEQVIWVGGIQTGLLRFDLRTHTFARYRPGPVREYWHNPNTVYHIVPDPNARHRLWVAAFGSLFSFNKNNQTFTEHLAPQEATLPSTGFIPHHIHVQDEHTLWLGTWGAGIVHYNLQSGKSTMYLPQPDQPTSAHNIIKSVLPKGKAALWVFDFDLGPGIFDLSTRSFRFPGVASLPLHDADKWRSNQGYIDPQGLFWIASDQGLMLLDPQDHRFQSFAGDARETHPYHFDRDKHAFWATQQKPHGLARLDTQLKVLDRFPLPNEAYDTKDGPLRAIPYAQDQSAVARGQNLYIFDHTQKTYTPVLAATLPDNLPVGSAITDLLADAQGTLWLGTNAGYLLRVPPTQDTLFQIAPSSTPPGLRTGTAMENLCFDARGRLWFSSYGISRYDPIGDTMHHFTTENSGLLSNEVKGICISPDQKLWIGSNQGVQIQDTDNLRTQRILNRADGLPGTTVHDIEVDPYGHLWLASYQGLARYRPEQDQVDAFTRADGLHFSPWASVDILDHWILSGSDNLKNLFHLDDLPSSLDQLPVYVREVLINGAPSPYDTVAAFQRKLVLNHRQNQLTLAFGALNFRQPQRTRYRYRLDGVDTQWQYAEATQRMATYANLPPGTFTFRLAARSGSGPWAGSERTLTIVILPPWWATWWANILFALLSISLMIAVYRFLWTRQLAREEARRIRDLSQWQTRLYTNLTHELRTPLTVISGMAARIDGDAGSWLAQGIPLIRRNAGQVLRLVNQLLDLARLDAGRLRPHWVQDDLVAYLRYLTESHRSFAELRDLTLHFSTDTPEYIMDFDSDKLDIILGNLLGNAIKFTPAGGVIEVAFRQKGKSTCLLIVRDSGVGIPAEKLPHIFQRFYQVEEQPVQGTGIGLSITREMVELLGGHIRVDSTPGKGTTFTIAHPVHRQAPRKKVAQTTDHSRQIPTAATHTQTGTGPRLLIIEDNPDVMTYLRSGLQGEYTILTAHDGEEGVEKARREVPDIILCDIMMPRQDGYAVTATLKQDERTSHIPIILLTARADRTSRHNGLQRGADAYLTKPFDEEELRIRLQQLIRLRRRLQDKYRRTDLRQVSQTDHVDPELRFLKRLEQVVLDHLDDETFRVEPDLCRAMMMSRPQLYRKLKALRGCSPSVFIRQVRLQRAQEFLAQGDLSVQEVAYRTGFRDPSHFARVYKAHYGHNPSQHTS